MEGLEEQLARFGSSPFLLTVGSGSHPHAVSVRVAFSEGVFTTRVGRSTRANATDHPEVTLLWPPVDDQEYSLIVDGTAALEDDVIRVTPTGAILHRTSARRPEDPAGSDCVAILRD